MLGPQIVGGLLSAGSKPKVPDFVRIDPTQEQMDTVAGNAKVLPSALSLTGKVNEANQSSLLDSLRKAIPGYDAMVSDATKAISDELKGMLPKGTSEAVQMNAAVKALSGGYSGSGMHRDLLARDLGLESLNITNQAIDSASRWISMSRQMMTPAQMDVTSMFLNPMQRIGIDTSERDKQYQQQWIKNQISAMPDPKMAAIGQAIIKSDDQMMSMASSVAGAAAGAAI